VKGAWAGLFRGSACLAGGGIERFSSASRRASIFDSTLAVRSAVFGCSGVIMGGPGGGAWTGLTSSGSGLGQIGRGGAFFLGRGVGEGSTRDVIWEVGVVSRPRGAGEVEVFRFAARGGLILVATGVVGVAGVVLGLEPEAVRFLPVVGEEGGGVGSVGAFACMTCRPSLSAVSMK
jgi:hypothetical protein